tara:strand:- start:519 stop:1298 length:780 start_codon:yes stop_codon:yes gene_type:complete
MGKPKHPKVYSKNQISKIKDCGKIVAEVLTVCAIKTTEGMSTYDVDMMVKNFLKHHKATSASFGYNGFPGYSCISVDEVILHGIPSKDKILEEGMIVGVDCPVKYKGMIADSAINIKIGEVDEIKSKLNEVAEKCLYSTLDMIGPGVTIGEICKYQEEYAKEYGYKVIKDFRGHGVGKTLHEPPYIPYYYDENNPYNDYKLKVGNVIAIEPTLVTNDLTVKLPDNWGVVTSDMSFGTSWEHTIVITDNGKEIITKTDII